jgi:7-cyano-7-deazaguanine synthase
MRGHPKRKERVVVLVSGGIDSTVTLHLVGKCGFSAFALIFDYSQRHTKEIDLAIKNARKCGVRYELLKIRLPWGASALTDKAIEIPKSGISRGIPATYVPGRNIIFLSFAVSFAEAIKAKKIFIGAHTQDYSGYPDCRGEFLTGFQEAANLGIKRKGIEIVAPLLEKRKSEIIRLGASLGVDFKDTWSCYQGKRLPCGVCDSCRYRARGFREAGLKDPLLG